MKYTTQHSIFNLKSKTLSTILIFIALLLSPVLKAQDQNYNPNPCPSNWTTTQFCFTNGLNHVSCERTVCITYTIKPDKKTTMGACPMPNQNLYSRSINI